MKPTQPTNRHLWRARKLQKVWPPGRQREDRSGDEEGERLRQGGLPPGRQRGEKKESRSGRRGGGGGRNAAARNDCRESGELSVRHRLAPIDELRSAMTAKPGWSKGGRGWMLARLQQFWVACCVFLKYRGERHCMKMVRTEPIPSPRELLVYTSVAFVEEDGFFLVCCVFLFLSCRARCF